MTFQAFQALDAFAQKPGIAIVPTSGCAVDEASIERGEHLLRHHGYDVTNYYSHQQRYQRFGATDERRLQLLYEAVNNPSIQIIMALRGSYGLSRLLRDIDFDFLAKSGKIFVGHSDFNALQTGLLAKTGMRSICGPMLCDDFSRADTSDFTLEHFFSCLRQREQSVVFNCKTEETLQVEGTLWGGNLAMLVHLIGSEYFPKIEKGILFLEDIGEHPYRVERMLLQLHHAGILENQVAIVLGDFSGYKLAPLDNGYEFDQMLAYMRSVVKLPIVTGLPFGHIKDKASLVIGAAASLTVEVDAGTLTMRY
jgi:muramoyltetrapeptide carboxypeptidase